MQGIQMIYIYIASALATIAATFAVGAHYGRRISSAESVAEATALSFLSRVEKEIYVALRGALGAMQNERLRTEEHAKASLTWLASRGQQDNKDLRHPVT